MIFSPHFTLVCQVCHQWGAAEQVRLISILLSSLLSIPQSNHPSTFCKRITQASQICQRGGGANYPLQASHLVAVFVAKKDVQSIICQCVICFSQGESKTDLNIWHSACIDYLVIGWQQDMIHRVCWPLTNRTAGYPSLFQTLKSLSYPVLLTYRWTISIYFSFHIPQLFSF